MNIKHIKISTFATFQQPYPKTNNVCIIWEYNQSCALFNIVLTLFKRSVKI